MIAPNMATTLPFVGTDAAASLVALRSLVVVAVEPTFNAVLAGGVVLAGGAGGTSPRDLRTLGTALHYLLDERVYLLIGA
jgi:hypothetical protein